MPSTPNPTPAAEVLELEVKARDLRTTWAELQVVHVPPSGIISFPNHSGFEVAHTPGSSDVLASMRGLTINLVALRQRYGDQVGHLYAVTIHSQPKPLEFREMSLEVRGPGTSAAWHDLDLADHAALLGVWWQRRDGGWLFEYSGQILDTLNATYQSVFLAGRYAERFSDR
ncbi:hypothetical protein HNQ07_001844 [Deinococcus metalli]|nr:hypothetical protein [Deinococcus metalli]MBB5376380.1 hypothetical protein [Deinococcus metalli]